MTEFALAHPVAGPVLRHIIRLGYSVSVFDLRGSMFGTVPKSFELHAVDSRHDPPTVHVVRVVRDSDDERALQLLVATLAQNVGIELE